MTRRAWLALAGGDEIDDLELIEDGDIVYVSGTFSA